MKSLVLLLIFITLLQGISTQAQTKKSWCLYAKTESNIDFCYYDSTSIATLENGHVIVWTMIRTNPDSVAQVRATLIETRNQLRLLSDQESEPVPPNTIDRNAIGYIEKLAYTLSKVEVDCQRRKFRSLTTIDCDENGIQIGRVDDPEPQRHWFPIRPGLVEESLMHIVCK